MTNRQPSFWRHFTMAYEDAYRVFSTMWPIVLTLVAIVLVVTFIGSFAHQLIGTRIGDGVLDMLVTAASMYLIAPYLFALYLAVARNEVLRPEALRGTPEAGKFAAWLVLTSLVLAAPLALYGIVAPDIPAADLQAGVGIDPEDLNPAGVFGTLIALIAAWIFTVRVTTLPPMLALDPAGATLSAALAQTRGQFWFIVGVQIITMLPVTVVVFMINEIIGAMFGPIAPVFQVPVGAVLTGFAQVMQVAVSTRLYERFPRR